MVTAGQRDHQDKSKIGDSWYTAVLLDHDAFKSHDQSQLALLKRHATNPHQPWELSNIQTRTLPLSCLRMKKILPEELIKLQVVT